MSILDLCPHGKWHCDECHGLTLPDQVVALTARVRELEAALENDDHGECIAPAGGCPELCPEHSRPYMPYQKRLARIAELEAALREIEDRPHLRRCEALDVPCTCHRAIARRALGIADAVPDQK